MIIQALCRYYDILAKEPSVTIPREGFSVGKVSFALVISPNAELSNIIDLRTDDKKTRPQQMQVPYQESRSSGIFPYFMCDNAKYVFGVEEVEGEKREKVLVAGRKDLSILGDNGKKAIIVSPRSRDCFIAFRNLHREILKDLDDPGIMTFLRFLNQLKPESFLENSKTREYKDSLMEGGSLVFMFDGQYLHENLAVLKAWADHLLKVNEIRNSNGQCLVTGQIASIARTHQKVKGVVGTQISGATLIGFNDPAFCSYGKRQSYNAPVSTSSMFKYTTTLNYLLGRKENRLRFGETTVVFWAETSSSRYEDLIQALLDPRENLSDTTDPGDTSKIQDSSTIQKIGDILDKVRTGGHLDTDDIGEDPDTNFYILGLSPNNARIAVRFWHVDSYGNFVDLVARHHLDMEIVRDDFGPRYVSMYRLLKETVPKSSKDDAASPLLGTIVMRSILGNSPYPVQMFSEILNRVKVERSINFARAGFIKAYLLRLSRSGLIPLKEDLMTVSLNEESDNVPYRLGRLFAVLEKAQSDTNREMKSTITSKYFSSASTTPAVVFPVLLKLAQHHIAKSDWGFRINQSIEEILAGVDDFPAFLNLEEQGMFMLGYYHQRKAFFKKKEASAGTEE